MPRKLIVEIVGDSRALERSYRRSSDATRKFGRDIGRAGRGAVAASGAFSSLGRSVAFASSAFLGGAGLVAVTKTAIDAASNLVEQQNKAKVVFGDSATAVQQWSKTTAASMGIAQDQALEFAGTFGNLLVPMGLARDEAAKISTGLVQLAADLASFNNASPEDTLQALRSALTGEVEPLRRFGVFLSESRVQAEALRKGIVTLKSDSVAVKIATTALALAESRAAEARAKYGATSRQYVAAQNAVDRAAQRVTKATGGTIPKLTDQQKVMARLSIIAHDTADASGDFADTIGTSLANQLRVFQASLRDLQASLGAVLLPIVSKVVKAFNEWLGRGDNKKRLVDGFRSAVETLGTVIREVWQWAQRLAEAFGGWKTALELAAGAWVGFKVAGVTSSTAILAANVYAAEGTAAAWKAALISTGWGALAVAAGAAAAYILTHWQQVKDWFEQLWLDLQRGAYITALKMVEPFSHLPSFLGGWARDAKDALREGIEGITADMARIGAESGAAYAQSFAASAGMKRVGAIYVPTGGYGPVKPQKIGQPVVPGGGTTTPPPTPFTPAAKTWLDKFNETLRRYQVALSKAELTKSLQDDLAVLKQEEAAIRSQLAMHKDNVELQEKLVDVIGQRKQLEEQITQAAKERRTARQFRALGLTATGEDFVPGVKGLRRELGQFEKNVEGTFLDTKKTQGVLSRIRRVLSGGLGAVNREVRQKIAELLDDLEQQLKEHRVNLTRFRHANTRALLAGLGLDPDELRAVRTRLATVGAGGVVPGRSSAAYGGAGAVSINTVNVYGVQDPRAFEDHMRKRQRSRPVQRRGA